MWISKDKANYYWSWCVCRLHDNTTVSFVGSGHGSCAPSYGHVYE